MCTALCQTSQLGVALAVHAAGRGAQCTHKLCVSPLRDAATVQLEEVGSLPRVQTRLRRTWDNLLSGLADTFTVIKLSTRLASYLGVGEQPLELCLLPALQCCLVGLLLSIWLQVSSCCQSEHMLLGWRSPILPAASESGPLLKCMPSAALLGSLNRERYCPHVQVGNGSRSSSSC